MSELVRGGALPRGLRLFHVDTAGASYWILSVTGDPSDLERAIEETHGVTFAEEQWERIDAAGVREVDEPRARTVVCRGDGDPDTDMWTAALEHSVSGSGRVVACSEWL